MKLNTNQITKPGIKKMKTKTLDSINKELDDLKSKIHYQIEAQMVENKLIMDTWLFFRNYGIIISSRNQFANIV